MFVHTMTNKEMTTRVYTEFLKRCERQRSLSGSPAVTDFSKDWFSRGEGRSNHSNSVDLSGSYSN